MDFLKYKMDFLESKTDFSKSIFQKGLNYANTK